MRKNKNYTDIILKPVISEKSSRGEGERKYIFEVSPSANKIEIRKAIEDAFRVKVEKVNIINLEGKGRIYKGIRGKEKDIKKALVKLKEGHRIEMFEAA